MSFLQNQRGNVGDIVIFSIILMFTGMSLVLIYFTYIQVQEKITPIVNQTWGDGPQVLENGRQALKSFDSFFVFFIIFLVIILIYSASQTESTPILLFIAFIVLALILMLVAMLANFHKTLIIDNPVLATANEDFQTTNWIVNHSVGIVATLGFVLFVALWAKFKGSTEL